MFTMQPTLPKPMSPAEPLGRARTEQVVLFPSLGHLGPDGQWHVQVHGDVFWTAGRISLGKRFLLRMLQRSMRVPKEALSGAIFQRRIARFLAIDGRDLPISVQIGLEWHGLPNRSRGNGHFHATLRVPAGAVPASRPGDEVLACPFEVSVGERGDGPSRSGQAYLVPPRGLSIISDIDDTLKHSHVHCRRTLLANTFLREFEPIAGMAAIYRDWAALGAAFHYVSSSPWQLYENLAEHFLAEGLPPGSFHLLWFRLRDHLLRRLLILRRSGKLATIQSILKTFPQRRFVLVGDSGEKDPEIYGALARKFPRQVAKIVIREIPGPRATPARFQKAFRQLSPAATQLFREPAEISDCLRDLLGRV